MTGKETARICTGTMYGINNKLLEPATNTLASDYMADHYSEILSATARMYGVDPAKVEDLVHDVYISIITGEQNGDCFDMNKGNNGDGIISVEEFVYGRIKGYTLNKRYKFSKNSDHEVSASSSGEDQEDLVGVQRAYESAASYDDIELVETMASMPEEIEFLLNFSSNIGVNIRFFLQNIHDIARMSFDASLFSEIRKASNDNEEFMTAIQSVVAFAGTHPAEYDEMLAGCAI